MSAKKFLALAISAYQAKQFEEAGILFAQAASSEEATKVAEELGKTDCTTEGDPEKKDVPEVEGLDETPADDLVSVESSDTTDELDNVVEGEVSVSSITRRKTTSLHQIGRVLAASMKALSSDTDEEDESEDDDLAEEDDLLPDPDMPGETLLPASFSSVRVKSSAITSPVKMKD